MTIWLGRLLDIFDRNKIIILIEYRFYQPSVKRDVARFMLHFRVCRIAKDKKQNTGFYRHLPISFSPKKYLSMSFILGLQYTLEKHGSILVVVDRFSKKSRSPQQSMDASRAA